MRKFVRTVPGTSSNQRGPTLMENGDSMKIREEEPKSTSPLQDGNPDTMGTKFVLESRESLVAKRRKLEQDYVLEAKGLSSLMKKISTQLNSQMEESENILETAVPGEVLNTIWDEFIGTLRADRTITLKREVDYRRFLEALSNSHVSIEEQEDRIGTLFTSVVIDTGATIAPLEELFEETYINLGELSASLVYASIFTVAMVVKFWWIFSPQVILKLASVPHIVWELRDPGKNGKPRKTRWTVSRGEIMYFSEKAQHLRRDTWNFWIQVMKPMDITIEREGERGMVKYTYRHAKGKLMQDWKPIGVKDWTQETGGQITADLQLLCYCYVTMGLSLNPKLQDYWRAQLTASDSCVISNSTRGSNTGQGSAEFWYFKKK